MKYPVELVRQFGAKAGILMHVARHLPDIPQARMVVKTPRESIEDFLSRAEREAITHPRLYRSSAFHELHGYEGAFVSITVGDFETMRREITNPGYCGPYSTRERFDEYERWAIRSIESSTAALRERGHKHLPKSIAVIAAEKSPSVIVGTYIKHPNQEGTYWIGCSVASSIDGLDPLHASFVSTDGNTLPFGHSFISRSVVPGDLVANIEAVLPWHDRIASLPEMDSGWSYQIEFGLFPTMLYQVRPFKRQSRANFTLPAAEELETPLVVGIAPRKGMVLRVETDIYQRICYSTPINPEGTPTLVVDELRSAGTIVDEVPNHQANLFSESIGFLSHNDIAAMRHARVSVLYVSYLPERFQTGDMVRLRSDGRYHSIERVAQFT
ncbi:hypothetical protein J4419_00530 [Candidatus Woesearchaeota archaeon]|nr:hypothetical protein [Candidatus Woesearchaeota archaeon]